MTNTAIKLIGLIVLFSCSCQSAYGISFGASSNGVSSQFDVQADESSSISGSILLDNMGLETVFSGSNIKKFNHTYEYPDSEGNKAILSVDLEKAKKVHLSVSPAMGFAEASETLSVKDADLIKTGSQAITSEGDSAKVELRIIEGSVQGYENYANAKLINEFGDKIFVAWQRADAASGEMVESSSQATYASEDSSLPTVSQVNSKMVVTDGQISELFSEAGRHTDFYSWDDGNYYWSSASHAIYVNQSAGAIGRGPNMGKKPSAAAMLFESEASAINSDGNTAVLRTSMLEGTINNYSNEARIDSSSYTESYSDGSYSSHGSVNWTSAWQNTGNITSNEFKTQVLAAEKDENKAALETSLTSGTVNGYNNVAGAGSGYNYNSNGYIEATGNAIAGWSAADANASDFETYITAANADGDRVIQMNSLLNCAFTGYSSMLDASSGSYFNPEEGFHKHKYVSSDQIIGALNAESLTSSLIASGTNASKSIANLSASDAYLENLYSHGEVSNDEPYEIPHAQAYNQADFISGSLIEALSYSRDQMSNATYAAMRLEGIDDANASTAGYRQIALTASPTFEYYPITLAWIRSTESASGNGTFIAGATNGMATRMLMASTILENETFTDFGRVRDGSPGAYFSVPDTGADPYNFIF